MRKVKRWAALFLSAMVFFSGKGIGVLGAHASIASETQDLSGIGSLISDMFWTQGETNKDNTWLFAGGVETQGRYRELGGKRSYVGHFEEGVRRTDATVPEGGVVHNGKNPINQRYVINVSKAGMDLTEFAAEFENYIKAVDPRAVAYLIGEEDYGKKEDGIADFKNGMEQLIRLALKMRNNNGFAVIQLPHAVKDEEDREWISSYSEAAREVIAGFTEEELKRVVLVDHFSLTDNSAFLDGSNMTEEGRLNEKGHLLIGRQLCEATLKNTKFFTSAQRSWEIEDGPDEYLDLVPTAVLKDEGLLVRAPKSAGFEDGCRWRLEICGVVWEREENQDSFVIEDLPEDEEYTLTVYSRDGKKQLSSVYGSIQQGAYASEKKRNPLQQKLWDKMEEGKPLKWLFTGDSITHGLVHTHGNDDIAQLFEKYLKEDLGRVDDIVLNTGVSATDTLFTLENINERIKKYHADVVSVMLGTNDVFTGTENPAAHTDANGNRITITKDMYKQNLEDIVAAIRESNEDAIIILRSPTPTSVAVRKNNLEGGGYLQAMRDVVAEDGNILYINQYDEWTRELETFTYLWNPDYYFGDRNLHPGAVGHLRMMQQFVDACGLNTDTKLSSFSYRFAYTEEESEAQPVLETPSAHAVQLSLDGLQEAYGAGAVGIVQLTLTDSFGTTYTKKTKPGERTLIMEGLPGSRHYDAAVVGWPAGDEAKRVTFAQPAEKITLSAGTEAEDLSGSLDEMKAVYQGTQGNYTPESLEAFKKVYDRVAEESKNTTDVEILVKLRKELIKAFGCLQTVQEENKEQNGGQKEEEIRIQLNAPAILSAAAVAEKKISGVKIIVQAVEYAQSYAVYRNVGGKETFIGMTNASGVLYDENPAGGKTASYYAVAQSSDPRYQTSAPGAAKTLLVPAAVKKVTVKQKGKKAVSISWAKGKQAKGYIVYRSQTKKGGYVKIKTIRKGNTVSCVDKGVKAGKKYYYRVIVKTKNGYGAFKVSKAVKMKKSKQ